MINEEAMLQLIDERDAAEDALGQAYYLATGRSPEWSNKFGHKEALAEIEYVIFCLKRAAKKTKP